MDHQTARCHERSPCLFPYLGAGLQTHVPILVFKNPPESEALSDICFNIEHCWEGPFRFPRAIWTPFFVFELQWLQKVMVSGLKWIFEMDMNDSVPSLRERDSSSFVRAQIRSVTTTDATALRRKGGQNLGQKHRAESQWPPACKGVSYKCEAILIIVPVTLRTEIMYILSSSLAKWSTFWGGKCELIQVEIYGTWKINQMDASF